MPELILLAGLSNNFCLKLVLSLNSSFVRVEILLLVCRGFVISRTSDNGSSWKNVLTPFIGPSLHTNNASLSSFKNFRTLYKRNILHNDFL